MPMNRGTKYLGVVSQLALALALSGCGAGADSSSGDEATDEVGSVTEALTTETGTVMGSSAPIYIRWVGVRLFMDNNDDHTDPTKSGYSTYVQIHNANPGRLHMRKILVDLTCTPQPWGKGDPIQTHFSFSGYINGNGGDAEYDMYCPYGFGYPYIIRSDIYTESSFGD
jgi:hypothetical protein